MTEFGLTPEGFKLKILRDILAEIETDQRAEISPTLDVSTESPDGQRNGLTARQFALAWELLQAAFDGLDPDKAEDDQLIALCKLTGTRPRAATFSEVACTINLDAGKELISGTHFAAVSGQPDVLFTPRENFIAPADGVHTGVVFRAENAGPVIANAGTLTVIKAGPASGWNSITNPLDAKPGQPADTNETLRARREAELAAAGSTTARAIRADLLQIQDPAGVGVMQQVRVLENDGDVTNADGVPPHSFEAIIYDSPALDNDLIAQTLFDSCKAAGIRAHGELSGTAEDDEGVTYQLKFSRPTEKNVWVTFEGLITGTGYPGSAAFKTAVVQHLRSVTIPGGMVTELSCWQAAGSVAGVLRIGAVKLGFSASPSASDDLVIGAREIAAFDTTRIVTT